MVALNGERLADLRDLLGVSQTTVAATTGVNQALVSMVERGERTLGEGLAEALSRAFGVPVSFFHVRTELSDSAPVTFRKKAGASVRDEKRIVAKHREAARLFAESSARSGYQEARLPRPGDYDDDPAILAEAVRYEVGLADDDPVPNVVRLAERLGVGVITSLEPGTTATGDHVSISRPHDADGRPLVALVASCPGDMARLSLAHEVGHLVLDRALVRPVRSTRAPEERRAYTFGSALLVHDSVMRKHVSENLTLHGYLPLKARYGISVAALIMRATHMGLISQSRARSLHIQRSSQGWTKHEPVEVATEAQLLLDQCYRRAFPGWSNHAVAHELGMMYRLLDDWVPDQSPPPGNVVWLAERRSERGADGGSVRDHDAV
ncbi:MAG: XRE family transcriptional regulator [Micrococcales bacterium]|nr:XRE family transcriptional regulator [Micrococcales bacterium]MCL2666757.1 XRE family transcriptional regulator [Micrococcales bacterium]